MRAYPKLTPGDEPECWTVEIKQRHQYFQLDYLATYEEARWMATMFNKAIKSHNVDRDKRKK